jgi:hypothetical protein
VALTVMELALGEQAVGTSLSGPGVLPGTTITGFLSGTGGVGAYSVSTSRAFTDGPLKGRRQLRRHRGALGARGRGGRGGGDFGHHGRRLHGPRRRRRLPQTWARCVAAAGRRPPPSSAAPPPPPPPPQTPSLSTYCGICTGPRDLRCCPPAWRARGCENSQHGGGEGAASVGRASAAACGSRARGGVRLEKK